MSNDGLSAIHTLVSNWFGNDKDGSLSDWANRKALETASFQYLLITHIALKIQFDLCRRDSPGIHLQRWCLKNLESRKRIHRFGQGQTSCARLQFPGHCQTLWLPDRRLGSFQSDWLPCVQRSGGNLFVKTNSIHWIEAAVSVCWNWSQKAHGFRNDR